MLADEINRTPPKTQAALLEAMQERQVTRRPARRHKLPDPFFVLATQNPIEQEGTYPLPEAQLDRFMFNIKVDYPTEEEEFRIIEATTSAVDGRSCNRVLDGDGHPADAGRWCCRCRRRRTCSSTPAAGPRHPPEADAGESRPPRTS